MNDESVQSELDRLHKRAERERRARQEAEAIAEEGTRQLYKRQRQLQLLYSIADAANRAASVEAAIQVALDEICAYTSFPIGHAYLVTDDPVLPLVPTTLWHFDHEDQCIPFRQMTENLRFRRGEGLPGRVLERGDTVWLADVTVDGNFPRAKLAREIGVRGAFAIPVRAGKSVVAVLEFFSREVADPDHAWLEMAAQVGSHIGRIFERDARDEADRANHAKSEFLSRMSHELRTPLNAILGFAQLLEAQKPTDTQRGWVGHILTAGRHLLELINEMLDISRIEAGELQLSLEPVCVEAAVLEAVELMRPLALKRGIEISTPKWPDEVRHVLADRQRFRQVLLNLLINAINYNKTNGRVTLLFTENAGDKIAIMISDTGAGIPQEKLGRLFVLFDRLGAEQSEVQGTGLGLALSKRLMEAMGGTISVTSTVGEGSTFSIEFRRAESPLNQLPPVRASTAGPVDGPAGVREKRTILYIEDNPSNIALIQELLTGPEFQLVAATQGRQGLELTREHAPDLILLDLHLPDLPGWEVLAKLKASAATRDIPVIVISADATAPQIKHVMNAGAQSYLTKPLNVSDFLKAIGKALSSRETVNASTAPEPNR